MNASQLVSVDSEGHIFFWEYSVSSLTEESTFAPRLKFRLLLDLPQYVPAPNTVETLRFPPAGDVDPTRPEDLQLIRGYMSRFDLAARMREAIRVVKEGDGTKV